MNLSTPLSSVCWHRLSLTLVNIRAIPAMSAHPVSVMQAIVKGVSMSLGWGEESPIVFHIKGRNHNYKKVRLSDNIPLEILFFRKSMEEINQWRDTVVTYLSDHVTGKNFEILYIGETEERLHNKVAKEFGMTKTEGEICLEFLTPFPFNKEKEKHRTFITNKTFIKSFENRFSRLFGKEIAYESRDDNFFILPYYWKYTEIRHPSISQQGHTQYINGCIGNLYLKGVFKDFLPFLILGCELHTGTKSSNSLGYYKLHMDPPGYFERYFPDKRAIVSVIRDVLDRYDSALESLSITDGLPFNEEKFADVLFHQIISGNYIPLPNVAFLIKKKGNAERMVEQLSFRDLIVQQYILKTVSGVFDRMFEEGSIGFRKGISRQKAIEIVQSCIKDGYQYVIESDIEDFFPSVDLHILNRLLNFYIPEKDVCLKNILFKSIRNGYVLNGNSHERTKGLAQGSPLSPIIANLYLDSFDEEIKKWDVKMIRYADDFIILARNKEDAENILSKTEAFLSELGLKIKKEKTEIRYIKDGFRFLGMRFERSDVKVEPEEEFKRFKKPLYITEPYLFLSLNGDAIDIKKDRAVIETIPIRRISEIMVMEKTLFSTALLKKCTENNIPFTITLNTGYYITTVKPDSKNYYDISFQHGRRYYSLSDTEILCIAKEFAAGKLNNYISLFRQRYIKEQNIFIRELEDVVHKIHHADDVPMVRGLEGSTAKKIYQKLNGFIEHEIFHIRKRDRKNPDHINSLLNFGYYLLFSRINATVRAVGLNPYLGFLHSPEDNYESFVCDIEELFRARIDRFIIRLINLKVITREDFVETEKGMYLKRDAIKKFLNQLETEMERKDSKNTLSLKEGIYAQVNIIKKWAVEIGSLEFYKWEV